MNRSDDMIEIMKQSANHIDYIRLKNENLEVIVTNYGATILKILVKDKNGKVQDVVLGYDSIEEYQHYDAYLGALVGRVANRIKNGNFSLNNKTYQLPINNGPNCLHGGIHGFSYQIFDYEIKDEKLIFHYVSADGEEGFPGLLDFYATYYLDNDKLIIHYQATSSRDTLINITNHTYFNLSGHPCCIHDHYLCIQSDRYALVDEDGLVTGDIVSSVNTPFDFRNMKQIKEQINKSDPQLLIAKGYDHPFLFNDSKDQVRLYCSETGIELIVSTTLPQAQIYSANYLDGRHGKNHEPMYARDALCIETQNMPDSIHVEKKPTIILKKGQRYDETTSYQLRVKEYAKSK